MTEHPVRTERVEFLNEPDDPSTGPLTLKFYLGIGHEVDEHVHPKQTETITVNQGSIRAVIDGEERILEVGDNERISPGLPHSYEVVGDEEAVLSVSITPRVTFKEYVVAEHALSADNYPEGGLNSPYSALVMKRYGPMIAPPNGAVVSTLFVWLLSTIGRIRRLKIPDEPLPVRDADDDSSV